MLKVFGGEFLRLLWPSLVVDVESGSGGYVSGYIIGKKAHVLNEEDWPTPSQSLISGTRLWGESLIYNLSILTLATPCHHCQTVPLCTCMTGFLQ